MATYNYKSGLGSTAAYQVSGVPFVKGGINAASADQVVYFPSVTSWVIINSGTPQAPGGTRVAFSNNGLQTATTGQNSRYLWVSGSSGRLDLKVTEIHLRGASNVQIIAGLTSIETQNIDTSPLSPSGSNWSGSLDARV
jgi:hypothetical protein